MRTDQQTRTSLASALGDAEEHDLSGRYGLAADALDALIVAARSDKSASPILVAALTRRASLYRYSGHLDSAQRLLGDAERLVEMDVSVDPAHACALEVELGRLALETLGPDTADDHLSRAVELARSLPMAPARDIALASSLAAFGASKRVRGDYVLAGDLLQEAVRHAEAAVDADPGDRRAGMELVHALDEQGVLSKFSGGFDASEEAYGRALELLTRIAGPDHPDAATIQHNLGGLAHARGDGVAAVTFARRAVELHEYSLGADHVATVLDRSALAAVLDQQGATTEAEALLHDCAERLERTLGPSHRELAVVLNNLAAIAQRAGRLDDAHDLYLRTADIKVRVQGPDSPSLAITLNNLATVQRRRGLLAEAAANYARALAILLASAGPTHPHVGVIRRNLARLGMDQPGAVSDS